MEQSCNDKLYWVRSRETSHSVPHLQFFFGETSGAGGFSPYLFLPYGEKLAHNHFNFGNFMFVTAGTALGFSDATLTWAAHYNSLFNDNGSGHKMDTTDDQRSIRAGCKYSTEHQFSSRTWSSTTGVSPINKK